MCDGCVLFPTLDSSSSGAVGLKMRTGVGCCYLSRCCDGIALVTLGLRIVCTVDSAGVSPAVTVGLIASLQLGHLLTTAALTMLLPLLLLLL
jgi:hypothetical protein